MRLSRIAAIGFAACAVGLVAYQTLVRGEGSTSDGPAFGAPTLLGPSSGRSFVNAATPMTDGDLLLVGQSDDQGWILRLDPTDAPRWSDQLSPPAGVRASLFDAAALSDGGVAAIGALWSSSDAPSLILRRYAADGAPGWETALEPGGFFAEAQALAAFANDDLLLASVAFGRAVGPSRQLDLGRFRSDGAPIDARMAAPAWIEAMAAGPDAVYAAGRSPLDADDDAAAGFWAGAFGADGALRWSWTARANGVDQALAAAAGADRLFAAGFFRDRGAGAAARAAVVALSAIDGDPFWTAEIDAVGADLAADHVVAAPDGGAVAAGQTIDRETGAGRLWVWRLDAAGATVWRRGVTQTPQLRSIGGLAYIGDCLALAVNASGTSPKARVALFRIGLDP